MIRAILFDMGGTLDGDGLHWLNRFIGLYAAVGLHVAREALRTAFDEAEKHAVQDEFMASANLEQMVDRHVAWQMSHLGLNDREIQRRLVEGFVATVRPATRANSLMLAELRRKGFELGVVSNGCGNLEVLCAEFGYAPHLSIMIDSRRVGVGKPDPAIFLHAADKLGMAPSTIMMVGDSFERDVRPAKRVGMFTAWLEGASGTDCPDPSIVDLRLRRLVDLPSALLTMQFAFS